MLRRSEQVGKYQGSWAGVSGYVEKTPDEQALIEITEETGLGKGDIRLIRKGKPLEIQDEELGVRWVVYPFLFHINDRDRVKIDWEHKELKWIKPGEISRFNTVPGLKETLGRVYKS